MLREQNKLVVNVRDLGYRVANPNEHAAESARQQRSARRRLRRAAMQVAHVALDALTPTERNQVLTEQVRIALKLHVDRRLTNQKALPARTDVAVPSGRRLIEMFSRKTRSA